MSDGYLGLVNNFFAVVEKGLTAVIQFNVFSIFGIHDIQLPFVVCLLLVALIIITVRTRFMNIRDGFTGLKLLLFGIDEDDSAKKENEVDKKNVNPVKAMFSVLSGSAGFGHTVGFAALLATLPREDVIWVLILLPFMSFFLMPIRFSEVLIGMLYRERREDGTFFGGPAYYIKAALTAINWPRLGIFLSITYAIGTLLGALGGGSSLQANQAVQMLTSKIGFLHGKELIVSLCFVTAIALVMFGSMRKITSFLTYVMPFTVVMYLVIAVVVICYHHANIVPTIKEIYLVAINTSAINIAKGFFVSFVYVMIRVTIAAEIGLGTATIMHSSSSNQNAVKEALLSTGAPILSTWIVCGASGLMVAVTGAYKIYPVGIKMFYGAVDTVSPLLSYAIMVSFFLMAFNVVVAWSVYGSSNASYIFGKKFGIAYKVIFLLIVLIGGITSEFGIILKMTDSLNSSVTIPNSITIILMSGLIAKEYKKYKDSVKKNQES